MIWGHYLNITLGEFQYGWIVITPMVGASLYIISL